MVAMSGGIDSSAVCLMLQDAGYEVFGMTMRVWDLPSQFSGGDTVPRFIREAQDLAARLGIEHTVVDARDEFRQSVVAYFCGEYVQGRTPNPCVICNRDFKFRILREQADAHQCQYMATGHYVRTIEFSGHTYLLTGEDGRKDQSYFLWRVPESTLSRCLFPLGGFHKDQVRAYLKEKGFEVVARQGESMEVCFIEDDYRDFLRARLPNLETQVDGGAFVNTTGKRLGLHRGVPFYTVGQRKGLGIALGHPVYVLRLNAEKNTIVIGEERDLQTPCFFVEDLVAANEALFFSEENLSVRIRYHSQPHPCKIRRLDDGRLLVVTSGPVSAVTPGQSAVFYVGNRLVAGSVIASQKGIGQYAAEFEK